ncbi:tyrosine--tRNA ligase [Oceanibaculum sp.]|uniref:tyrosine--tRNA ligase n=1 Tax=Oceanibaculum sp. TaxID=1903597 RepID=UPI00258BFA0A|nr:tyrosine--tRNA ligase [Oceanibaculum sp.]MCH2393788.1 tyrosine--tRNA ligase [Oceanibaculum sp.]
MTSPTATPKSDFLRTIVGRGYMHQCTDIEALDGVMAQGKPVPAYIGFDATADSLHVGSLVQIMMLRQLQKTGHKPVVLMGGGTSKIGDPSFRDEARKLLSDEDIQRNLDGIKRVFGKYLTFGDGPTDAVMVNNADWLDKLEYIPFLRDYGRHFSINRMLSFESVKIRLDREQSLSFLEFNYMILQAYDFVELWRRGGVQLQMGGSDQWGNIVNGIELGRRVEDASLFGLTSPLITTASGAKMGKTANGAVWLNDDRLSPYDFWQFWRNTEDADVGRFLRLFTELPLDEIARLEALEGAEINEAKKVLAFEATKLCHGADAANEAAETARRTFEEGATAEGLPTVEIPQAQLAAGLPAYEALRIAGLAASNGEARRLIKGGGARLNDAVIADENAALSPADLADGVLKLSAGKKRHTLLKPV